MAKFLKRWYLEIIFITPMVLYVLGFTVLPILQTIMLGFKDEITGQWSLSTYQNLFTNKEFNMSIINTVSVTLIELVIQMVIGFFIASALKRTFKGRGIVRSLVLMPMGIPTLVSGVTMLYIFGTQGYINEFLYRLNLIKVPINWLAGGVGNLFVIAIADSWKVLPMVVLLLLAGLESIPREVYEASSIDGASKWQDFRYVTLPLLKPTITMTVLTRAIDAFRIFELPQILAGRVTPFISTIAYSEYDANNYSASGAASTVLLVIIVCFVFLYLKYIDKGEGLNGGK